MLLTAIPPAVAKLPPAYRSLPDTASEFTGRAYSPTPDPSALQLLPFHLAMLVAAIPPAVAKKPPAYRSLPGSTSASTSPITPPPPALLDRTKVLQLLPFHLAMPSTSTPPAIVKLPPT